MKHGVWVQKFEHPRMNLLTLVKSFRHILHHRNCTNTVSCRCSPKSFTAMVPSISDRTRRGKFITISQSFLRKPLEATYDVRAWNNKGSYFITKTEHEVIQSSMLIPTTYRMFWKYIPSCMKWHEDARHSWKILVNLCLEMLHYGATATSFSKICKNETKCRRFESQPGGQPSWGSLYSTVPLGKCWVSTLK